MRRNIAFSKIFCNYYVFAVFAFNSWIYYTVVFQTLLPQVYAGSIYSTALLALFNALTFMFLWSIVQTMITDPGRVPLYWGFFLDDPEHKKRRYCLICHIFKPERCHHCSTCNRCVLNMDHHCPWINNCVGFSNRKFFLLLVIYATLDLFLVNIILVPKIFEIVQELPKLAAHDCVYLVPFTISLPLLLIIANFLKFHMQLIFDNMTTIENLERQKQLQENQQTSEVQGGSKFDVGIRQNWVQVWGEVVWLYPFPLFGDSGNPIGDGVIWPQSVAPTSNLETQQNYDGEALTENQNIQAQGSQIQSLDHDQQITLPS